MAEIEAAVKSIMEAECCNAFNEYGAVTVLVDIIRAEGERCEVYQRLIRAVQSGDSDNNEKLKPSMVPEIKHELSVINGVVCGGSRVVVLAAVQRRVTELNHRAHQGMSKAKNFLQAFCWFPGMDRVVENQVRECLPCQAVHPANTDQPVKPSELPSGPWQYVEIDFQGQHNDKQLCGLYLPIRASQQYVSRTTDHHSSHRRWQTSRNIENILTTTLPQNGPEQTESSVLTAA